MRPSSGDRPSPRGISTPLIFSDEREITRIVQFKLDPNNLPELIVEQKFRLSSLKDEDIDYSDIPPQIWVQWTRPGALVPVGNGQKVGFGGAMERKVNLRV